MPSTIIVIRTMLSCLSKEAMEIMLLYVVRSVGQREHSTYRWTIAMVIKLHAYREFQFHVSVAILSTCGVHDRWHERINPSYLDWGIL